MSKENLLSYANMPVLKDMRCGTVFVDIDIFCRHLIDLIKGEKDDESSSEISEQIVLTLLSDVKGR